MDHIAHMRSSSLKRRRFYRLKKNLKVTKVITKNYIVNGSSLEKRNEEFP